jgi:hypothetical protein
VAALAVRGKARRGCHEEDRLAGDKLRQALVQLGIDLAHDVLLRALSL